MNEFIYFHSLKEKTYVKNALMNEAWEMGIFPVKDWFHYGIIEIDEETREMTIVKFEDNKTKRDDITRFLQKSKARSMVLFTYYPVRDKGIPNEPMIILQSEHLEFQYGFLGRAIRQNNDRAESIFGALGINLQYQKTNHAHTEAFLADIALAHEEKTLKLMEDGVKADFIIPVFTLYEKDKIAVEKIILGSNNDYLRVYNNGKYFFASNSWTTTNGRRKSGRGGHIMGGNILVIEYMDDLVPSFTVFNPVFLKAADLEDFNEFKVADGKLLNIDNYAERAKLLMYDKEEKLYRSAEDVKPRSMGFSTRTAHSPARHTSVLVARGHRRGSDTDGYYEPSDHYPVGLPIDQADDYGWYRSMQKVPADKFDEKSIESITILQK